MDNRTYLRVKIKSLAAEARIIRAEEDKLLDAGRRARYMALTSRARPRLLDPVGIVYTAVAGSAPTYGERLNPDHDAERLRVYRGCREHRVRDVRLEARAACLAMAYIRGRAFTQCEARSHDIGLHWKTLSEKVGALVVKYGGLKWRAEWLAPNIIDTETTRQLVGQLVAAGGRA